MLPVVLPILPASQIAPYMAKLHLAPGKTAASHDGPLPQYFGDQLGWPEIARAAAQVYAALPRILSAHNAYWYWGSTP